MNKKQADKIISENRVWARREQLDNKVLIGRDDLEILLNYLSEEEKHYQECSQKEKQHHIFKTVKRLKRSILNGN